MTIPNFLDRPARALVPVAAAAVLGLAACEPYTPPQEAAEPEPPPPETVSDVVGPVLHEMLLDRDPYSRARRLATLLADLGPGGVPAVRELLENGRFRLGPTELGLLVRFWATHEGRAASAWAAKQTPEYHRKAAVMAAVSAWVAGDPRLATEDVWGWPLEDQDLKRVIPIAAMQGWRSSSDPEGFADFLRSLPPGPYRQRGLWAHQGILIEESGIDAAVAWAGAIPDDEESAGYKMDAHRRLASLVSARDLEAARNLCERVCDEPYGNNVRSIVASFWVKSEDATGAMEWLAEGSDVNELMSAAKGAYVDWLVADRESALGWMEERVEAKGWEQWLEESYPLWVVNLGSDDPEVGIERAQIIQSDWRRDAVLAEIARIWRGTDEAAAEAWLNESGLSDSWKEKARKPMQRMRIPGRS